MFEESYAYYPPQTVEKIRNDGHDGRAEGRGGQAGRIARRAEVDHLRQRGFHQHAASAVERSRSPRRRASATPTGTIRSSATTSDTVDVLQPGGHAADMREVFDTANRQNTSIYAVDPRGLAAIRVRHQCRRRPARPIRKRWTQTIDSLRVLAGQHRRPRHRRTRNDLAVGMKQIIRDASGYYLLGYNSTQAPTDGKFHEIKVRVTRRNVDVRAPQGLLGVHERRRRARDAPPPKPDAPSAVTAALNAIAEPPRPCRAEVLDRHGEGDERLASGHVRVGADVERGRPGARSRERRESGHAHGDCSGRPSGVTADVSLKKAAPAGNPGTTMPSSRECREHAGVAAGASALRSDALPGPLQLRMVVENSRGQVMDSRDPRS